MDEEHAEHTSVSVISKSRLEFLFDGVFAIAMTLLVLELKVPELVDRRSVHELAAALAHDGPTFGSYLLSFTVLGALWYRHNHQYHHFRVITGSMLVLHFVQLATAAFFPFCAALFGRHPFNPLAGLIYVSCILVYAWASLANWLVAWKTGSVGPATTVEQFKRSRRRALRGSLFLSAMFVFYLTRVLGL
jgi:uncharacterized membrane protein